MSVANEVRTAAVADAVRHAMPEAYIVGDLQQALERAKVAPSELDLIVVATDTPDSTDTTDAITTKPPKSGSRSSSHPTTSITASIGRRPFLKLCISADLRAV